jgi:hypothetical protein
MLLGMQEVYSNIQINEKGCTSPVATQFTELDSRELGDRFTAQETARWILYIKVGQQRKTARMCTQNRMAIPEDAEPLGY